MHPAIAKQKEFLKIQLLVPANQAKPSETNQEESKKRKRRSSRAELILGRRRLKWKRLKNWLRVH